MVLSVVFSFLAAASIALSVPVPNNDPFYQPPAGFQSSAPGTVFKSRPSNSTIAGVTATQILYRTNDAIGRPVVTVATILKTASSSADKLVAYQNYEDAADNICSPSYAFNTGSKADFTPEGDAEIPLGLANGWTIVVADYEGFNSSFGAGHLEGQATLDAIRATLNYGPAGVNPSANIGLYGYSGGAIATGWAAALQANYAPELNVKGIAFGGIPANISTTLQKVDGTLFAGFGFAGTSGIISAYPAVQARFNQIATPLGQAAIAKVRSQCAEDDLTSFAFQSVQSPLIQTLGPFMLYDPVISSVLAKNVMGSVPSETPKAPLLMYHSQSDEVIPYASSLKAAQSWCSRGANIDFRTDTGGAGHSGLQTAYAKNATDWLALRMNGTPPPSGCKYSAIMSHGSPLRKREVASRPSDR